MAHTPLNDVVIDTVPGRDRVPLGIWITPARGQSRPLTERLAYRLIATYSAPGDTIIDLTDSLDIRAMAAAGGRTHIQAAIHTNGLLAVTAVTAPPPETRSTRSTVTGAEPPTIAEWFGDDLQHLDRPPGTFDNTALPRKQRDRRPALFIGLLPAAADNSDPAAPLTRMLSTAAKILRPGGITLLVIDRRATKPIAAGDYTIPVTAAGNAGLRYTQHLIAIHAEIAGDRFITPAATTADLGPDLGLDLRHASIHDDVLVFDNPHRIRGTHA